MHRLMKKSCILGHPYVHTLYRKVVGNKPSIGYYIDYREIKFLFKYVSNKSIKILRLNLNYLFTLIS